MAIEPRNKAVRRFDDNQVKVLGNYVYALRDPRDNKVFYIGQATKENRVFSHFEEAEQYLQGNTSLLSTKVLRIIEIWAAEEDVDWFILAHGVNSETNCLDAIESAAIDLLTECQNGPALNRVRGPHSSIIFKEQLEEFSAEPINPNKAYQTIFIFPIHKQLANGVDTYTSTRRAWYIKKDLRKRNNAIAIGLSNYISKGVYLIDVWHKYEDKHEFDGTEYKDMGLLNKNWFKIISSSFGYWQRGNYLVIELDGNGRFRFIRGNPDKETWFDLR